MLVGAIVTARSTSHFALVGDTIDAWNPVTWAMITMLILCECVCVYYSLLRYLLYTNLLYINSSESVDDLREWDRDNSDCLNEYSEI